MPSSPASQHARTVVLLAGLIVISGVSLVMLLRGTDPVEVAATFFFAPVFVGFVYFGARGGTLLAVAAAAGYVALRRPAIELVGFDPLAGRIVARGIGYLVFGIGGGWAASTLLVDLDRLEADRGLDPLTGLHDAAAFRGLVTSERERCNRYGGTFALVVVPLGDLPARRGNRRRALAALGRATGKALRRTDHLGFVTTRGTPALVAVLTGTGAGGAGPAVAHLNAAAEGAGLVPGAPIVAVYPDDATEVDRIVAEMSPGVTTTSPA